MFYVEIEKPAIRDRKHDHQFCNQRLIVILTQSFWNYNTKAARRSYRAAEEDARCCAQNRRFLQNVDVLTGQRLVHAAHGTELAAHAAGVAVVVLRQAGIADGLCGLRVQCAGELCIPVQYAAGIAHLVVNVPGVGDALGDVGGVCGDNYEGPITNCYYLSGTVADGKSGIGGQKDENGKAEKMSLEQFKSGEVAWLLNGSKSVSTEESTLAWYQKLGENADAYPVLKSTDHNTVYKAPLFSCDGTTRIGEYANKPEGDKLSHNYQMAEKADEGTSNLYSEECAICHN